MFKCKEKKTLLDRNNITRKYRNIYLYKHRAHKNDIFENNYIVYCNDKKHESGLIFSCEKLSEEFMGVALSLYDEGNCFKTLPKL